MTRHLFEIAYREKYADDEYGLHGFALAVDSNEAQNILRRVHGVEIAFETVNKVPMEELEANPDIFQRCVQFACDQDGPHSDVLVEHLLQSNHNENLLTLLEDVVCCNMPKSLAILLGRIEQNNSNAAHNPHWLRQAVEWDYPDNVRLLIAHGCTDADGRCLSMACDNDMRNMFELLLPVSNPSLALNRVLKNTHWIEEHISRTQHALLSQHLPEKPSSRAKKI